MPVTVLATININRPALKAGSAFYELQPKKASGVNCSQASVAPFVPVVESHEGLAYQPSSHTNFYRAKLQQVAGPLTEGIANSSLIRLQTSADSVMLIIRQLARDSSSWANSAQYMPQYCVFKYFAP